MIHKLDCQWLFPSPRLLLNWEETRLLVVAVPRLNISMSVHNLTIGGEAKVEIFNIKPKLWSIFNLLLVHWNLFIFMFWLRSTTNTDLVLNWFHNININHDTWNKLIKCSKVLIVEDLLSVKHRCIINIACHQSPHFHNPFRFRWSSIATAFRKQLLLDNHQNC